MRVNRILATVLVLTVVVLLNLPLPACLRIQAESRDGIVPFQSVASVFVRWIRDSFSTVTQARDALRLQRETVAELGRLRDENRRVRALEQENRELRALLGFKTRQQYRMVLCDVVSRGGASGWWQTVQLDRGSQEGIGPDMAVVTPDGVVGRTVRASRQTSDVLLVTDPMCRVACKFAKSGAYGISRGLGVAFTGEKKLEMVCAARPFRVDYVDKEHEIAADEDVVTSGLGGVYPEGIPVGRVLTSELDVSGLYRRAEVMPAANLDAIRYVFVVVPANGARGR